MKSVEFLHEADGKLSRISRYFYICKIKVVALLVITAWIGVILAPDVDRSSVSQLMSLLGIGLISASAAAINHIIDREVDKKMSRTCSRPLAKNELSVHGAIYFAFVLFLLGSVLLYFWANVLTLFLTFMALIGYAVVYTVFLKRATPQNIVIGGLAGAMPPLLGWVSETGHLDVQAWLLVMIIFVWTPPHFWALAIAKKRDYEKADIPMLPVTHGSEFTRLSIVFYSILLFLVCLLPYLVTMSGDFYLISVFILNSIFLYMAIKLYVKRSDIAAMALFRFSISYLLLLFISLFLDQWIS